MRYNEIENATFKMWHGSRKWDGTPEIRMPRVGRYEGGPGIYFTNSYSTAYKYAKGGGSVMLAEINSELRLSDDVLIPMSAVIDFIKKTRMIHKREIIADVEANGNRMKSESITANVLVNLMVNYEAGAGNAGVALAHFLTEHGVDASTERKSNDEVWLIVINPRVIQSIKKIPAKDVPVDMYHLPPPP